MCAQNILKEKYIIFFSKYLITLSSVMEFFNIVKTAFFCGDNVPRSAAEQQILMFKD